MKTISCELGRTDFTLKRSEQRVKSRPIDIQEWKCTLGKGGHNKESPEKCWKGEGEERKK